MTATSLLRCPDVLTMEEQEIDEDELWKELEAALRAAGETFKSSRNREGENLRADLLAKLAGLEKNVQLIQEREPKIMEEYRARLEEKTKELLDNAQIDEGRIAAEVVLFADKICTDEETVRLLSHIQNMRDPYAWNRNREKARFSGTGDEPGGEYHSLEGKRSGNLEYGCGSEDRY